MTQTSNSTIPQALAKSADKRKRESVDDETGDEEKGRRQKTEQNSTENEKRQRKFACPFYKKSPEIYGKIASCLHPGFTTTSRLKEHLYRVHAKSTCPRCHEKFENNDGLVTHLVSAKRCDKTVVWEQEDGLNGEQINRIKRRYRGIDEEKKWRDIYRTWHHLSDDAETPSPYCNQDSPTSQAVEGYGWYVRQRLPDSIRGRLGRHPDLQHMSEIPVEPLLQVTLDSLDELFRSFTGQEIDQFTNEHGSNANSIPSPICRSNEQAEEFTPNRCPMGSPIALEAPSNTDRGMTSGVVQQLHALSGQQCDGNTSAYGSPELNSHQSEQTSENNRPVPLPASERAVRAETSSYQLQPSHDCPILLDVDVTEPLENPDRPFTDENLLSPRIEDSPILSQSQEDPNPDSMDEPLVPQINYSGDWLCLWEIEPNVLMQYLPSFDPGNPFGEGPS